MLNLKTGITALLLLASALFIAPARAGSIFDDDYVPARPPDVAPPATEKPAPAEKPTPPPAENVKSCAEKVVPTTPSVAAHRAVHAVPDKTSRATCRKLFEEAFAKELKDHSPTARKELAKRLVSEAAKVDENSPDQFVLLGGAIQAAAEGQDLRTAFAAADALTARFAVDGTALKVLAAMRTFGSTSTPGKLATVGNVERLLELTDVLVAADDIASANQIAQELRTLAASIDDPELKGDATTRADAIAAAQRPADAFKMMALRAADHPDDAANNLAFGSMLCFQFGEWGRGLPLLANSNDAKLKQLARDEMAKPSDGKALTRIGDQWSEVAAKYQGVERKSILQHVAVLDGLAVNALSGLEKLTMEKRLTALPPPRRKHVDLIEQFDEKHVVKGNWRPQESAIICLADDVSRMYFAYMPPEEYDFHVTFTPGNNPDAVGVVCQHADRQFIANVGAWYNTIACFELINGVHGNVNKSAVKRKHWLTTGQRYTLVVKVRRAGADLYLNGDLITSVKTDYSDMSIANNWELPRTNVVAIGASRTDVRFDEVQIIEVAGQGTTTKEERRQLDAIDPK